MPGGSRAGAGRKATPIDLIQLENLCALQCSDEEIASWFEVSIRTIQNRRAQAKFGEVMRRGQAKGKISIRRAQMRLVEAGNVPMTIWLGKHLLGQGETRSRAGWQEPAAVAPRPVELPPFLVVPENETT